MNPKYQIFTKKNRSFPVIFQLLSQKKCLFYVAFNR